MDVHGTKLSRTLFTIERLASQAESPRTRRFDATALPPYGSRDPLPPEERRRPL
jgi:hypothetical protein